MTFSAPEQPLATDVDVTEDALVVQLEDGRELRVPLEWFPRLRDATPTQRARYELIGGGLGIHWPDVDEDISVRALLVPEKPRAPRPIVTLGDDEEPIDGSGANETWH